MEYTVTKLGQMAGISARTLRYYDEIGILKPARINSSGYRIYGQAELDRLIGRAGWLPIIFAEKNLSTVVLKEPLL